MPIGTRRSTRTCSPPSAWLTPGWQDNHTGAASASSWSMHDARRLTMADTVTPRPVIAQLVETMRALAGAHPGFRPVHAKGIVCAGTFRGTREARGISRALHLQGQAIPTIVRFSNG